MKTMVAHFENDFKDIEIVSEPLDIKSSLKPEDLPKIEKMADDIKASIDAAEIKEVLIYKLKAAYIGGLFLIKGILFNIDFFQFISTN